MIKCDVSKKDNQGKNEEQFVNLLYDDEININVYLFMEYKSS